MRIVATDFPAAHSADTEWFAVDANGHVARFIAYADSTHSIPKSVVHAGGRDDNDIPYDFPSVPSGRLYEYIITEDSPAGIYVLYKSPVVEFKKGYVPMTAMTIDDKFLAHLPIAFKEVSFVAPHHHVPCTLFGKPFGPFDLGEFGQFAFVDYNWDLCPLPKRIGDPTLFFQHLADLAICAARNDIWLSRRGCHVSGPEINQMIVNAEHELQAQLKAWLERGDEARFEETAKALKIISELWNELPPGDYPAADN